MTTARKTVYDTAAAPVKYVFLDRDGVINVERGNFTTTIEEWEWTAGAFEGLRLLTEAGFGIIVVTNQSCIARGIQTEKGLAVLHRFMVNEAAERGGHIIAVYHCPHTDDDNCSCRKPKPGMLIQAADDYGIDLKMTFFIGDTRRDMEAGKAAGVRTLLIEGTKALKDAKFSHTDTIADYRAHGLVEAARIVIDETSEHGDPKKT